MKNFTRLETIALIAITKDDFYEDGFDSQIWTDVYFDNVPDGIESVNALKGIIGSLQKKEAIYNDGETIAIIEEGQEYLITLKVTDLDGFKIRQ